MREHVISEIQRISKETGKVPGIAAFEQSSGIPRKEIIGKLWARWSEAIEAAGLKANSFDRESYPEAHILKQIAKATKAIGRWPAPNDLRLYARNNPGFPSTTTIENRYPRRSNLVEAMQNWILEPENSSYAEIKDMLPAIVRATDRLPEHQTYGHVYLLRSGDYYKIGQSSDIERRVKSINVALPNKAILEHAILTDDPPGIEAYWHRRFADKRANGEWFKLSKADILAFKKRKFQ